MSDLQEILQRIGPRPDSSSTVVAPKKNYSERLSRALAQLFADKLRSEFPGVLPSADGSGQESRARTARSSKKLDVNYSTTDLGLGLGVSIKTINFKDGTSGRFNKNFTRADNEFRAEAQDYHHRQPFAVLCGVLFLPIEACGDASDDSSAASSFASAVQAFRFRGGRRDPRDLPELFEEFFVACYEWKGPQSGDVWFFDVREDPPRFGMPVSTKRLALSQALSRMIDAFRQRNDPPISFDPNSEPMPRRP